MDSKKDQKEKPTIDISDLPPKQAAYALLRENGLKTSEAANILDYKQSSAYQLNAKLNKYSLTSKKMTTLASTVVKNCMTGTAFGTVDKIKDSTALQAASMVYDRVEPAVKQTANLNVNVDISPVDLSKFKHE
jgi:hypothetical protein